MVVRRLAVVAIAIGLGLALAGCNTSAFTKRELVVDFHQDSPQSQHQAAFNACEHASPAATPEPFSTSGPLVDTIGNVRFRIDHANDKEIATLEACFEKQPGVAGFDIPDLTD
jgi:hypothetical protein